MLKTLLCLVVVLGFSSAGRPPVTFTLTGGNQARRPLTEPLEDIRFNDMKFDFDALNTTEITGVFSLCSGFLEGPSTLKNNGDGQLFNAATPDTPERKKITLTYEFTKLELTGSYTSDVILAPMEIFQDTETTLTGEGKLFAGLSDVKIVLTGFIVPSDERSPGNTKVVVEDGATMDFSFGCASINIEGLKANGNAIPWNTLNPTLKPALEAAWEVVKPTASQLVQAVFAGMVKDCTIEQFIFWSENPESHLACLKTPMAPAFITQNPDMPCLATGSVSLTQTQNPYAHCLAKDSGSSFAVPMDMKYLFLILSASLSYYLRY